MKSKWKWVIFVIPFTWICCHVTATALYLLPVNPLSRIYLPVVHKYMEPIFSQNWHLFAPEPATSSLQFWYRCGSQPEGWGEWRDPLHGLIAKHQENRFSHRGKLIYVYQGLVRNLANHFIHLKNKRQCFSGQCLSQLHQEVEKTKKYQLAKRFVRALCGIETSMTSSYQFQILKVFPKAFSRRHEKRPYERLERIEFPIIIGRGA